MKHENYDFCGWATRNDLKCSDGRVIRKDAFKHCDGVKVPLMWNHDHTDPYRVIGHAMLENRNEGVYAYCSFNDTDLGKTAKIYVEHGDITSLSIYANQLREQGPNVMHGNIREVSLVIAGANPGAYIDTVISHSDDEDGEAVIYTGMPLELAHADGAKESKEESEEKNKDESGDKETVADVFKTLTDKQKKAVYFMMNEVSKGDTSDKNDNKEKDESKGGDNTMKHNVFENDKQTTTAVLSHSDMQAIFADAKRTGSFKEAFQNACLQHGIEEIELLFPDARTINRTPEFIKRDTGWVQKVMSGTHHTPFSRVKSLFANITEDEARAKGYIKGKLKKEEVFSLLKRTTDPQTIYKKQKLDRDDVIDIVDFDVVAWIRGEMRMMLEEEAARAILIGDGRLSSDDDKISPEHIRPVAFDADLYTIKTPVATPDGASDEDKAKAFIKAGIKARKNYKGSGTPTLFTTEDMLTDMLLIEDTTGRTIYADEAALARKLRVKEIVTVPVMEGQTGPNGGDMLGIIVNLADYNIGADKGGEINNFEDFDIDYNQMKYLIETRMSGALIKPYSAIVLESSNISG